MVPADNCAGSTVGAGILDISQEGQDPREQCVKKLCRGWMVEHPMPYLRPYTGEHSLSREGNDISQSEWELKMKLSELETSCVLSIQ